MKPRDDTNQPSKGGQQTQNSRQSAEQGAQKKHTGKDPSGEAAPSGIGSSHKQDRGSAPQERPSAGTPDIERGARSQDVAQQGSQESLVNDSVGAFKERP